MTPRIWLAAALVARALWAAPDGPPYYDPHRGIEKQQSAAKSAVSETTGGKDLAKTVEHLGSVSAYVRDAVYADIVKTYPEAKLLELSKALLAEDALAAAAVAEALGSKKCEKARPALEAALKKAKHEEVLAEICWALGELGSKESADVLLKTAEKYSKTSYKVGGDAYLALAACDQDQAAKHLEAGLNSKLAGVKIVCLAALLAADEGKALDQALAQLDAKHEKGWEERVWFQALEVLRTAPSRGQYAAKFKQAVEKLVNVLASKDGRLAHDIAKTLRSITGESDMGDDAADWKSWWEANKNRFEPADRPTTGEDTGGGGTVVRYFGIPVYSKRLTFLLDLSGGMDRPIDGEGTDTPQRLQIAKEELVKTLEALAEDAAGNVIFFATEYFTFAPNPIPFKKNLKKLAPFIGEQKIPETVHMNRGNLYDPLILACEQAEIDTVYLVTEGNPTEGRFIDRDRFVRHMMRTVRFTKTEVVSLFIGSAPSAKTYLKAVSEPTGGKMYDVAELRKKGP